MNFLSRLTLHPLKALFQRVLMLGVAAQAVENVAERESEMMDAQEKVFEKGIELIRKTKLSRESEDDLERQFAADFVAALRETTELGRSLLGQVMNGQERQEVLSRPLSDSSPGTNGSQKSLLGDNQLALNSPETKATETTASPNPDQSIKRKRGRPRKNP